MVTSLTDIYKEGEKAGCKVVMVGNNNYTIYSSMHWIICSYICFVMCTTASKGMHLNHEGRRDKTGYMLTYVYIWFKKKKKHLWLILFKISAAHTVVSASSLFLSFLNICRNLNVW